MMNTHIEHLEDLILDYDATDDVVTLLKELGDTLRSGTVSPTLSISTKWDGSPAIVFGPDPADGQFFVATKAAFNKTPKLAKSIGDIQRLYPEAIWHILRTALAELSTLHPTTVLQADVLFIKDASASTSASVRRQIINGTDYLTFKPNTILYAVPQSHTGLQIAEAEIGIAIHTSYIASSFSDSQTLAHSAAINLSPDTFASMHHTSRVWAVDAGYDDVSGSVMFTETEAADFDLALAAVKAFPPAAQIYTVVGFDPFNIELRKFINHCVRLGVDYPGFQAVYNLVLYLSQRKEDESNTRITPRGKSNVAQRYNLMLEDLLLPKVREGMVLWFELHRAITRAKLVVIRKLEQANTDVLTFAQTATGYRPTGPEGFVVTQQDRTVKLIDRQEFSRRNFNDPRR
jgi:hypothetical protein